MEDKKLAILILTGMFFLILLICAAADIKQHKVSNRWTAALCLPGLIRIVLEPEDRWETAVLTCLFFFLMYFLYRIVLLAGRRNSRQLSFGGADVKLMFGMMLFLGWKEALHGIFAGLSALVLWYAAGVLTGKIRKNREVALVPWLVFGVIIVELFSF